LPREQRDELLNQEEIFGFLAQSRISDKNTARLHKLSTSANPETARLAEVALEVALVTPFKRRRINILARNHRHLLRKLEETGLIFAHGF